MTGTELAWLLAASFLVGVCLVLTFTGGDE
jgi:hypothetical protein